MSDTWNQSQTHFQSLDAIDRLRDSLREEHGLMLQVGDCDLLDRETCVVTARAQLRALRSMCSRFGGSYSRQSKQPASWHTWMRR